MEAVAGLGSKRLQYHAPGQALRQVGAVTMITLERLKIRKPLHSPLARVFSFEDNDFVKVPSPGVSTQGGESAQEVHTCVYSNPCGRSMFASSDIPAALSLVAPAASRTSLCPLPTSPFPTRHSAGGELRPPQTGKARSHHIEQCQQQLLPHRRQLIWSYRELLSFPFLLGRHQPDMSP